MPVLESSIVINAPVEKVFAIEDDPKRLPEYLPGIAEIAEYERTPERIGETSTYVYKAMGMRFRGGATLLERDENKRIITKIEGGVEGTNTNTYEQEGEGTRVTWHLDYRKKGGILGSIINKLFVERQNERNAAQGLENLKSLCESG